MANSQTNMRVRIEADLGDIKAGLVSLRKDLSSVKSTAASSLGNQNAFVGGLRRARAELAGLAATYISLQGARVMAQMADEASMLRGRIREAKGEYGDILELAQRSRTGLTATVDLYARLERSTREQGFNQEKLLALTESVNQAVALSYTSAASGEAALFQLGQGLATGALRGEELNSVMEQTPRLAQAIADGLGVPIGKLRELAKEGKLTTEVVTAALQDQARALENEYQRMPVTISSALRTVRNSMLDLVGDTDKATGASDGLTESVLQLAEVLNDPATKQAFAETSTGIAKITANLTAGSVAMVGFLRDFKRTLTGEMKGDLAQQIGAKRMVIFNREQLTGEGTQTTLRAELAELRRQYAVEQARARLAALQNAPETRSREEIERAGLNFNPNPRAKIDLGGGDGEAEKAAAKAAKLAAAEAKRELSEAQKDLEAIENVWREVATEQVHRETELSDNRREAFAEARQHSAEMIGDMQDELALTRMSAVEKEKFIALRYLGATATDEERAAVVRLVEDLHEARETEALMYDIQQATAGLATSLVTDFRSAGDALDQFLERLAQIAIEFVTNKAIQSMFDSFKTSGSGSGGGSGDGFWSAVGTFFAGMFHTGGIAGAPRGAKRAINPLLLGNAPRYHTGGFAGLGSNEVAAVLEKGEEILTEDDPRHTRNGGRRATGGGAYGNVIINNNSGMAARTEERPGPNGTKDLVVFIENTARSAISKDFASGTGSARVAQQAYGLQRQGTVLG